MYYSVFILSSDGQDLAKIFLWLSPDVKFHVYVTSVTKNTQEIIFASPDDLIKEVAQYLAEHFPGFDLREARPQELEEWEQKWREVRPEFVEQMLKKAE